MPMRFRTTLTLTAAAVLSITAQIAQADEQELETASANNNELVIPSTTALSTAIEKDESEEVISSESSNTSDENEPVIKTPDVTEESEEETTSETVTVSDNNEPAPLVVSTTEEPETTAEVLEAEEEITSETVSEDNEPAPLVVSTTEEPKTTAEVLEAEEEITPEAVTVSDDNEPAPLVVSTTEEPETTAEMLEAEEEITPETVSVSDDNEPTPLIVSTTEEPETTAEVLEAEEEITPETVSVSDDNEPTPLIVRTTEEPETTAEVLEAEEEITPETVTVSEEGELVSDTASEAEEEVASVVSLENKGDVFGIQFYGSEKTDPAMLQKTMDILKSTLDRDGDGQADKPELTQYMADNNYKVVVANSPDDLSDVNQDGFDDATTIEIFSQSLDIDGEIFESLKMVAGAQYSLLKKKAQEHGDLVAQEELTALNEAIAQLKENKLSTSLFDGDEEDDDDIVEYLIFSELAINGQLSDMLERFSTKTLNTIKALTALSGKDVSVTEEEEAQVLPDYFKAWKSISSESFQSENPLICAWLNKHSLSAPIISLEKDDLSADGDMVRKIISSIEGDSGESLRNTEEKTTQNTGV